MPFALWNTEKKYSKTFFYKLCHTATINSLGHRVLVFTKRTAAFLKSSRIIICAMFDRAFTEIQIGQTGQ